MLRAISYLFLCFCIVPLASAQQQRGLKVVTHTPDGEILEIYENSWAVVIGINQYQKWPKLQYAVNDAQAVKEKLVTLGFPPSNIIYLKDEQATKMEIERTLGDRLRRKMGENDRVFIYFAGHGQTEDLPGGKQEGYIVPVDGDKSDLFSTCISMTSVRQFSQRMAAKHVFYAIDACYSGLALMRAGELDPADRQYVQKIARFPARQLVTAGSAGEQVVEQGGHGAFTRTLLIALDGSADKYPPFGVLTGSELGNYLQPTVSLETQNAQTPQFGRLAAGEGEFMFVLPDVGVDSASQTDQYRSQAEQYEDQIEKLKAQLETEQKRQVEEEAARLDAKGKKKELEELQAQLEAAKRTEAPVNEGDDPNVGSVSSSEGYLAIVSMNEGGKKDDTMDHWAFTIDNEYRLDRPGRKAPDKPRRGFMGILLSGLSAGSHNLLLEKARGGTPKHETMSFDVLPGQVSLIVVDQRGFGFNPYVDDNRHMDMEQWKQYVGSPKFQGEILSVFLDNYRLPEDLLGAVGGEIKTDFPFEAGYLAILSMSEDGKKGDTMDELSFEIDGKDIRKPGKSIKGKPKDGFMGAFLQGIPSGKHTLVLKTDSAGPDTKRTEEIEILSDKVLFIRMDWRFSGIEIDDKRQMELSAWRESFAEKPDYVGQIVNLDISGKYAR